jgi:predicted esterase
MGWLRLLLLLHLLCASCTAELDGHVAHPVPETSERTVWAVDDNSAPAADDGAFEALEIPKFLPAVVFAPSLPGSHPLIVAAHGAGGMPEHECAYWRRLSQGRAYLLCPRGERTNNLRPSGYYYRTHLALEQELNAALEAFRRRFPGVSRGSTLYAGFSQGAIMGAALIADHGDEFPYLALLEGGYEYWSPAKAQRFARAGGKRVLFVCGTQWCADKTELPAQWLRRANVGVRIEYAPGAGHTPSGEVMNHTRIALPWLTAGDEVWQ